MSARSVQIWFQNRRQRDPSRVRKPQHKPVIGRLHNPNPDPDPNANTNPDPKPNPSPNPNANPDPNPDPTLNPDPTPNPDPNPNQVIGRLAIDDALPLVTEVRVRVRVSYLGFAILGLGLAI